MLLGSLFAYITTSLPRLTGGPAPSMSKELRDYLEGKDEEDYDKVPVEEIPIVNVDTLDR